jgi:DNA-binding NtrC family response regulator
MNSWGKPLKTILFLCNKEGIQDEATRILQEEGYQSLFASSYDQAVEYAGDEARSVAMVILDIDMLVDGGIEIYDRIKDINPDLPVVTTSTAGHYRPRL